MLRIFGPYSSIWDELITLPAVSDLRLSFRGLIAVGGEIMAAHGSRGCCVLPHAAAPRDASPTAAAAATTPRAGATCEQRGVGASISLTVHTTDGDITTDLADREPQGRALIANPLQRAAPSRWTAAASTATAAATSLPGAAFRESATLRASFWLCRGCDLAWSLHGAAAAVCPTCHVAREDMQLQAGATELAQVRAIVEADHYGRSLQFANNTEQPIGAPPALYANPNADGFNEAVRSTAVRLLASGVKLSGSRTDAVVTFESWLLLTYDAEFSVLVRLGSNLCGLSTPWGTVCAHRTDYHHPYSCRRHACTETARHDHRLPPS